MDPRGRCRRRRIQIQARRLGCVFKIERQSRKALPRLFAPLFRLYAQDRQQAFALSGQRRRRLCSDRTGRRCAACVSSLTRCALVSGRSEWRVGADRWRQAVFLLRPPGLRFPDCGALRHARRSAGGGYQPSRARPRLPCRACCCRRRRILQGRRIRGIPLLRQCAERPRDAFPGYGAPYRQRIWRHRPGDSGGSALRGQALRHAVRRPAVPVLHPLGRFCAFCLETGQPPSCPQIGRVSDRDMG